ncbi:hypothetical protein ACTU6U_01730 [Microbacterium sp. A196]|uniref:hypothetical protein n=1 Tax=Microbacterium sp. A196 TaxID=3457320 RepID=UPI003FD18072
MVILNVWDYVVSVSITIVSAAFTLVLSMFRPRSLNEAGNHRRLSGFLAIVTVCSAAWTACTVWGLEPLWGALIFLCAVLVFTYLLGVIRAGEE